MLTSTRLGWRGGITQAGGQWWQWPWGGKGVGQPMMLVAWGGNVEGD